MKLSHLRASQSLLLLDTFFIGQACRSRRSQVQFNDSGATDVGRFSGTTFWTAATISFLAMLSDLVQCVEGGLQVYKAYHLLERERVESHTCNWLDVVCIGGRRLANDIGGAKNAMVFSVGCVNK